MDGLGIKWYTVKMPLKHTQCTIIKWIIWKIYPNLLFADSNIHLENPESNENHYT